MVRRGPVEAGAQQSEEARGRASTAESVVKPPTKKGRRRKKEEKDDVEMHKGGEGKNTELIAQLSTMAKLLLQNSQQGRDLASAVITTWFIKKDRIVAIEVKAAMTKYSEKAKGGDNLGPPHLHAALAFLEAAKKLQWEEEEARIIKAMDEKFEGAEEETQCKMVPFFRLKKIQKQDTWLLQYRVHEEIGEVFSRIMKKEEATFKGGRAPVGVLERSISRALQGEEA